MNLNIEKIIEKIDKYKDRIFICPLKDEEIINLEKKLNIEFPVFYVYYLRKIGLLQDLIQDNILNTEAEFIFEKDFINRIVKDNPDKYFAIGNNGFGDLLILKDKKENDDLLYLLNHENGKITKTKQTFIEFINKAIDKSIKEYNKRKFNKDKKWIIQINFDADNDNAIIDTLKNKYEIEIISDWFLLDETPAGVREYQKKIRMDKQELIIKKSEYKDWGKPNFSINLKEDANKLLYGSFIIEMDLLFRNNKALNYKLVKYGIL